MTKENSKIKKMVIIFSHQSTFRRYAAKLLHDIFASIKVIVVFDIIGTWDCLYFCCLTQSWSTARWEIVW